MNTRPSPASTALRVAAGALALPLALAGSALACLGLALRTLGGLCQRPLEALADAADATRRPEE